jgi:mono/diheme cytochrome c family protein
MRGTVALAAAAALLWVGLPGPAQAVEKDPVKVGHDLVEHLGCLYCHGLGGRRGLDNPNAKRRYVPSWDSTEFTDRYPTPEKVRQTIREGRFPEKAADATGSPIPMPPWGNRLTDAEMDDIISYIWSLRNTPVSSHPQGGRGATLPDAVPEPLPPVIPDVDTEPRAHGMVPQDKDPAFMGRQLVEHLGCLYCHGLGGKHGLENPNAKRKYVPSWDEKAFAERYPVDDGVRYVIEHGRIPEKDAKATGSPIPMPPWGNRLTNGEVDAIVAYIWSLRQTPVETHPQGGRGRDLE